MEVFSHCNNAWTIKVKWHLSTRTWSKDLNGFQIIYGFCWEFSLKISFTFFQNKLLKFRSVSFPMKGNLSYGDMATRFPFSIAKGNCGWIFWCIAYVTIEIGIRTFPRQTLPRQTLPRRTLPRQTLPRRTLPRRTLPRPDISPSGHIPDGHFPDGHFPDKTFPRADRSPTDTSPTDQTNPQT